MAVARRSVQRDLDCRWLDLGRAGQTLEDLLCGVRESVGRLADDGGGVAHAATSSDAL